MKRIVLLVLPLLLFGCVKKIRDNASRLHGAKWSGTYAAPILVGDLALKDVVSIGQDLTGIGSYPTDLLYLEYKNNLLSKYGYELVKIGDQTLDTNDVLSSGELSAISSGSSVVNRSYEFDYQIPGQELDSVFYGLGKLKLTLNNQYPHACNAVVTIPGLRKNGAPAVINMPANNGYAACNSSFDFSEYTWDMTAGGTGVSRLRFQVTLNYTNGGTPTGTDKLEFKAEVVNQKFHYAYGYFGMDNLISEQDSLELSIFSNKLKHGDFNLSDPKFKLKVVNPFGMPLQLTANSLSGSVNGILTDFTPSSNQMNIADVSAANKNAVVKDSMLLDKTNSTFKTAADKKPGHILYDVQLQANPGGKIKRNFIGSGDQVSLDVVTQLPFQGETVNLVLEDTTDFDLGLGDSASTKDVTDIVDFIQMRFQLDNQFPVTLQFQGYFIDAFGNTTDSVFKPMHAFATGASVDANGNVISAGHDQYDLVFEKSKIKHISEAKKIRYVIQIPTSRFNGNPTPVKLTGNMHFFIKLGIQIKLSADERF